jgi:membrane protease YdiL (CAAX protease family)
MKAAIRKHPVVGFVVIAFGWTWPLAALIEQSLILPLLGLFGPCVAAVAVVYACDGRAGLARLGRGFRPTRALATWGVLAALLPLVLLVPVWLLHRLCCGATGFGVGELSLLSLVVAVLIVGEEVGWRGFLLPFLLERHPPLTSSFIVGLIWAVWHLPNFLMPNYPHFGLPFSAFVLLTLAFSVLFTWLHLNTSGSLLIAVIFHAALNIFSLAGVEPSRQYWLKAAVYGAAALLVGVMTRKRRRLSVVSAPAV